MCCRTYFFRKGVRGHGGDTLLYMRARKCVCARARKGVTRIRALRAVTLRGKGAYGVGEKGRAQGLQGAAAMPLTRLREG